MQTIICMFALQSTELLCALLLYRVRVDIAKRVGAAQTLGFRLS